MIKISIIVPVYNEEKTIDKLLWLLKNTISSITMDIEVIVVNDGSSDKTEMKIKKAKNNFNFIYIKNKRNLGKGAAIKRALKIASGDYFLIQDGDLEYNPREIKKIIKTLKEESRKEKMVAIFGKRNNLFSKNHFIYFFSDVILSVFVTIFTGKIIKDVYTGYKLVPANIFRHNIISSGFEIESEITIKLIKNKIKIIEIPINYYPRLAKEGKKIKFFDFIKGIFMIAKLSFGL